MAATTSRQWHLPLYQSSNNKFYQRPLWPLFDPADTITGMSMEQVQREQQSRRQRAIAAPALNPIIGTSGPSGFNIVKPLRQGLSQLGSSNQRTLIGLKTSVNPLTGVPDVITNYAELMDAIESTDLIVNMEALQDITNLHGDDAAVTSVNDALEAEGSDLRIALAEAPTHTDVYTATIDPRRRFSLPN